MKFPSQRPSSYEVGGPEYERNIIVDCFGAGRLEEYRGKHKLDLCIVYGAEPWSLSPAPGGRDNALMVRSKRAPCLSFTLMSISHAYIFF